ncbi:MAG: hypothetical protein HQ592_03490 [Planctomycetes bacterium]|nr:hypothetical protein [Planctomycetota bacterium]
MSKQHDADRPHAHVIWGMHGGYFLADYDETLEALCRAERTLKKRPELVYNMEFEAYTLDRLARGPSPRRNRRRSAWPTPPSASAENGRPSTSTCRPAR